MSIQLTEQQQQAIDAQAETPPCIIDPRNNTAYYLVPVPEYDAVRELLEDERQQKAIRDVGLRNTIGRTKVERPRSPRIVGAKSLIVEP